jgi:hypothetical protein
LAERLARPVPLEPGLSRDEVLAVEVVEVDLDAAGIAALASGGRDIDDATVF